MRAVAALPALLLMTTAVSSGCMMFGCGHPMTMMRWKQAGIYETMPPPGKSHGFEIEYVDDHGGPEGLNHVARRSTYTEQVTVAAEPDDTVYYDLAKRQPLDDAATAKAMNSSFARLRLAPPRPDNWHFEWQETIC